MTGIERAVEIAGSQTALAEALGVQQAAVSKWVRRGFPSQPQRLAINRRYGIPIIELLPAALRRVLLEEGRAA